MQVVTKPKIGELVTLRAEGADFDYEVFIGKTVPLFSYVPRSLEIF